MRIQVIIPEGTKLYGSYESTRRVAVSESSLEGYVKSETNTLVESRAKVVVPQEINEDVDFDIYFVNTSDLIFIEDSEYNSEELSDERYEELNDIYYESHMTDKQLEEYNKGLKTTEPVEEFKTLTVEDYLPSVRLKPGVTYDFDGKRIGNLPNDYLIVVDDNELVTLRNKATGFIYKILKSNIIGY